MPRLPSRRTVLHDALAHMVSALTIELGNLSAKEG